MSQPPAPDDPFRSSGSPGQREPTRQWTPGVLYPQAGGAGQPPPGPYGQAPPGPYGQAPPAPYGQPQPGPYGHPAPHPQQAPYPPQGGYPGQGGYGPPWTGAQGGPGSPPPKKGGNGTVIALVAVGVLLVVGLGVGLFLGLQDDSRSAASPPPATLQPTGLGDDPAMDELAQECFDGDMQSCDDLFMQSDSGSTYEDYGDTCAGRQSSGGGFCTLVFGE